MSSKVNYSVIFITCSSVKEAETIVNNLLKTKLVACGNIIPNIKSIYWWQGKIEKSREFFVILKTKRNLVNKIVKEVKILHSYTVPEIIALPIIEGSKDYLNWISKSTI